MRKPRVRDVPREGENRGVANLYNKQTLAAFTRRVMARFAGDRLRARARAREAIGVARNAATSSMSAGHASFFSDDFRMPREIPNDDRDRWIGTCSRNRRF
jgi:hypothetical protein